MMITNILRYALFSIAITGLIAACSDDTSIEPGPNPPNSGGNSGGGPSPSDWLIPSDLVVDGGPGKDGIPSIDDPQFSPVNQIDYLEPDDLVLGFKVGNEIRAYPHPVLDWHEIVNDDVNGTAIAITYCPLTGTGIGWNRFVGGSVTTFGVSGLLYNNNLLPYDRATDSNWSQMLLKSVNGNRIGTEIEVFPLVETTWATWQELYPDSRVLNLSTGFSRSYGVYPYGDYKTNNDFLLFPLTNDDTRLERKERGLGIIVDEEVRFYRFNDFSSAPVVVRADQFGGRDLVIAGSRDKNFLFAYQSRLPDGTLLQFNAVTDGGAVVMEDQEGSRWNVFGEAVSGPRQGKKLPALNSYIGYWFSWGAFFPGVEIYGR